MRPYDCCWVLDVLAILAVVGVVPQCLALGQQPPPIEEFEDESAPDVASIDAHKATLVSQRLMAAAGPVFQLLGALCC